ncbi:MAG: IS200/IS605 family transposase [Saprospiraceae bacterium]|nr:IS200/IS605 family transposase [Saprospiraceae bacterium]
MANSYSKIYLHIIFVVKYRDALLHKSWRTELFKYITGIVKNKGHKMVAIGGVEDHIHFMIGYNINQKVPDLVKEIKTSTNEWINKKKILGSKFYWQKGYSVFSHSHGSVKTVSKYILNQEEHHREKSFREEYLSLLKEFAVEYEEEYIFKFFDP